LPIPRKRPRDFSEAAELVIDIATGQVEDRGLPNLFFGGRASIVAKQSVNLVLIEGTRPAPQFKFSTRPCAFVSISQVRDIGRLWLAWKLPTKRRYAEIAVFPISGAGVIG
jgi:hypothetical protein